MSSDIYSYSSFRQYLKDQYEKCKSTGGSGFTYRSLSAKAGINSSAFFKFVIDGKRNLTAQSILKTCIAFNIKGREAEYFEQLVFFNQAKTMEEKDLVLSKLIALQRHKNIPRIKNNQLNFFHEWYHCVIRELVTMADFSNDWMRLGQMLSPPITSEMAEKSVKVLLELGFLKKENGRYVQIDPVMTTGHGSQDFQVIRHQIRMMQMSIEAYERCRAQERMTSTTTMGVSQDAFELIVDKIRDFRDGLAEIVGHDRHPERVYQLNISMIPVSQKVEPE
ncbi:MAG: hypothetical protein JWO30_4168 [Fibrobacteres bacterium]|nr:hypothetical protein [Fibrobacterota bacterium]